MKIIKTLAEMRALVDNLRSEKFVTGLVPTMGALHEGHLELINQAKLDTDFVICSIFVNPAQFNKSEDLQRYPRSEEEDCKLLRSMGCDAVFLPHVNEMYQGLKNTLVIDFGELEKTMEGEFRPGHFAGVGLVVGKLFNIVQPQVALFGTKDLQQLAVIKKMVKDLNFPIQVVAVETVREVSGLAMSSRNLLFTKEQKKDAGNLFLVLNELKQKLNDNDVLQEAVNFAKKKLNKFDFITVEYLEIVKTDTLEKVLTVDESKGCSICCAAEVHGVRLIDNIAI